MTPLNQPVNEVGMLEKLKEVSFFSMFAENDEIMNKIARMCERRAFRAGSAIIEEGEYGDELFIIVSGEINIEKKTMQNERYTVTTLDSTMGGLYVGELALIDNDRRSASVMANTDCDCLVIDRDEFLKFGDQNPTAGLSITRAIASQLAGKLRKTNEDVITLFSALVQEIAGNE